MGRASYDEALLPLPPLFVISTPAKGLIRRKCNVCVEGGKSEGVCTYLHKSRILPGVSPSPFERRLPPSLDLISATHHPITGADNGLVPQILACGQQQQATS